jgi:hypothetical protein
MATVPRIRKKMRHRTLVLSERGMSEAVIVGERSFTGVDPPSWAGFYWPVGR